MQTMTTTPMPKELNKFRGKKRFEYIFPFLWSYVNGETDFEKLRVNIPEGLINSLHTDPKIAKAFLKWMCSSFRGKHGNAGCLVCGKTNKAILGVDISINPESNEYLLWLVCNTEECANGVQDALAHVSAQLDRK